MALGLTPSQTVGPFFHFGLPHEGASELVPHGTPGSVRLEGTVVDGAGDALSDAMVEIWQANRAGRYAHPEDRREELPLEEGFAGFGRSFTDADGRYGFTTVKPGRVPAADGRLQAPHIEVAVFARGLLKQLVTRIYFPDEQEANGEDPLLAAIGEAQRTTLVAQAEGDLLRFDIHLQGERETVFLDV